MTIGKFLKNVGHEVSKGSKSIGHVFEGGTKKIEGAVSDVYHDVRSGVSYTGKHLINDVDNISNALSNPMLWIAGGVVIVVLLSRR